MTQLQIPAAQLTKSEALSLSEPWCLKPLTSVCVWGGTDKGTEQGKHFVRGEHCIPSQFHTASRTQSLNPTLFTGVNQVPDILELSMNRGGSQQNR